MSYENAPATRMLATHCALCDRPLVDALSVEIGIGPTCRENCGYSECMNALDDETRRAANVLVHKCALARHDRALVLDTAHQLAALGALRVAHAVMLSLASVKIEADSDRYTVTAPYSEFAVAIMRNVPGRRWDKERKVNTFPLASKLALFAALQASYPGQIAMGPKGAFML